jgi:hypothetical protein
MKLSKYLFLVAFALATLFISCTPESNVVDEQSNQTNPFEWPLDE